MHSGFTDGPEANKDLQWVLGLRKLGTFEQLGRKKNVLICYILQCKNIKIRQFEYKTRQRLSWIFLCRILTNAPHTHTQRLATSVSVNLEK